MALFAAGCSQPAPPAETGKQPRIVSLAPNLTEILCALGAADALVGRTSACNRPAAALAAVPVVGGFGEPSMEMLVAARPTVVVTVDLADETLGRRMDQAGLRHERVPCSQLDDIPRAAARLGRLAGKAAEGDAMAARLSDALRSLRAQAAAATNRPRVLVEIWHDPLMTAGGGSFLSELVSLSGGTNVAAEIPKEYFQVSPEWVLTRDPQVILCLYMSDRGARSLVLQRPGWHAVTAVARGAVFDGFDNDALLRPGPRALDGIEAVRRRIREGAAMPVSAP